MEWGDLSLANQPIGNFLANNYQVTIVDKMRSAYFREAFRAPLSRAVDSRDVKLHYL